MNKTTFNSVVEGMAALHAKKNADYGDSFHESWEAYENKGYPPMACYALGRIRDKYTRLENLVLSKNDPNFESIEDNLADLASYCIMSLVELKNINNQSIINQIMYKEMLDRKVLVRSYDAGVYFGTLTKVEGETCRLENVRNIWSWDGASCLSQIANDGIKGGRVSPMVDSMVLNRVCQIIPLSEKAIDNLSRQTVWQY